MILNIIAWAIGIFACGYVLYHFILGALSEYMMMQWAKDRQKQIEKLEEKND